MRVLIVGSGGREHALAWAVAASPLCEGLHAAPGNAGIAEVAQCHDIVATDAAGLIDLCRAHSIDFVVIGPEEPLVLGLADALRAEGIGVFGPSAAAARLEGSKAWMKDFCTRHAIPTAGYHCFTDCQTALVAFENRPLPIVIKTDGLAAGKGVTIATDIKMARDAVIEAMQDQRFGDAGSTLIIEDYLQGEEVSFFALLDGDHAIPLAAAQDHKRLGEGDTGPNTGGMGAYSPPPCFDQGLQERVMAEIIQPVLDGMRAEGHPYRGVLFAGLMIVDGAPKLLEYNIRFGDPECQVLMARLRSDVLTALLTVEEGGLRHFDLRWSEEAALCVVMAARGYPGTYEKGTLIDGVATAGAASDVEIFHAATVYDDQGRLRANGGRVLGVTACGSDLAAARTRAYEAVGRIDWPGGIYRRDIGWRALEQKGDDS